MLDFSIVDKFLKNQGRKVDTQQAPQISLDQTNEILFLESGSLDLFALDKRKNKNSLQYLIRFNGPFVIFGFPSTENFEIVASTNSTTKLTSISIESLLKKMEDDFEFFQNFSLFIGLWVHYLSQLALQEKIWPITHYLDLNSQYSLDKSDTIQLNKSLINDQNLCAWVKLNEGSVSIYGEKRLSFSSPSILPLYLDLTLVAEEASKVTVLDSKSAYEELKHHKFWMSELLEFNKTIIAYQDVRDKEITAKEKLRLNLKNEIEKKVLDNSLRSLSNILALDEEEAQFVSDDALVNAFQKAVSTIDVQIPFEKLDLSSSKDQQAKIMLLCQASGIRYRQVILTNNWWKSSSDSILAFYGPKKVPVALISESSFMGSHYALYGVSTGKIIVDESVVSKIDLEAFSFYTPLPNERNKYSSFLNYYFKLNKSEFVNIVIFGFFSALFGLFPPLAIQLIFDQVIPSYDLSLLHQLFIALLSFTISMVVFLLLRGYSLLRLEGILSNQLQGGLWDHLLKLRTSFFRKYTVGDLIERVNATEEIRQLLSGSAIRIILSAFFSFLYLFLMFYYSAKLSLFVLSFTLFSLIIYGFCFYKIKGLQDKTFNLKGKANGLLIQIILGLAKIRISGSENNAFAHWAHNFTKITENEYRSKNYENIIHITNSILPVLYAMVIFSGFLLFIQNKDDPFLALSPGEFLGFFTAFTAFSIAIQEVTNIIFNLMPIFSLWNRAKPILEEVPEFTESKKLPGELTGNFHVDNVTFSYPNQDRKTLSEVSIRGKSGQFIAILGPSGSGKSSLIKLLLGFERPEKGTIYFDGKDMENLDIRFIRKQFGVVLQDDAILSGTLRDNVTCGRIFTDEQILEAFKRSGFIDDYKDMPMGLHTMFSAGGTTLSGGQRQRLFIARALVGKPKILIFDEATSALDNKSQEHVSKSIDELKVTRIVIAHRLSTIQNADYIYLIDHGKLIDHGTYDELEKRSEFFQEMLNRQKL